MIYTAELYFLIVLKNGVQFQARLLSSENALLGLEIVVVLPRQPPATIMTQRLIINYQSLAYSLRLFLFSSYSLN